MGEYLINPKTIKHGPHRMQNVTVYARLCFPSVSTSWHSWRALSLCQPHLAPVVGTHHVDVHWKSIDLPLTTTSEVDWPLGPFKLLPQNSNYWKIFTWNVNSTQLYTPAAILPYFGMLFVYCADTDEHCWAYVSMQDRIVTSLWVLKLLLNWRRPWIWE
jgi:hypothetical protein